jgi:putative pyruvate formate lyase activating enzyme
MQWLAEEISPDTYVNVMGQYQPQYQVGEIARDGKRRYESINRRPTEQEIATAYRAAHDAGLSRLDART